MKKFMLVFLLLIISITLTSCKNSSPSSDHKKNTNSFELEHRLKLYKEFLRGKVIAKGKNNKIISIRDYFDLSTNNEYALYDMNHDGLPELHVRGGIYYLVFTIVNNRLVLWHEFTGYEKPLNNGAVLYIRDGAAPAHVDYQYSVFDFYGNETLELGFSKYSSKDDGNYDTYYFNDGDEDVQITSKTDWDKLTQKFLSIKSNKIKWKSILLK